MRARVAATTTVLLLAGVGTACVSLTRTPEARFFVLRSLAEPPPSPAPAPPDPDVVAIGAVRLPGHLERPQVVTWRSPNEVQVDEFVRWAEPLDAGIARILQENLAILLPERRIVGRPWPGDLDLGCRVVVALSVFGMQGDGSVRLQGRWTLLPGRGDRPLEIRSIDRQRGPGGAAATPASGIDAMSELLAELSAEIAEGIRALPEPGAESPSAP